LALAPPIFFQKKKISKKNKVTFNMLFWVFDVPYPKTRTKKCPFWPFLKIKRQKIWKKNQKFGKNFEKNQKNAFFRVFWSFFFLRFFNRLV